MSIVSSGQVLVNTEVIPYIRRTDVEFAAFDLLPYKSANFYFDETDVTNYCQRPSEIVLTYGPVNPFTRQQEFINQNTGAYFTLLDVNSSNTIYLNENFVTVNVTGATSSTDYEKDDIVVQYENNDETTNNAVFVGRVAHWEYKAAAESWLVLKVEEETTTSLNVETGYNSIWNKRSSLVTDAISLLGNVAIDRYSSGNQLRSISDGQLYVVDTYKNYSGQIVSSNNTTTRVVLAANVPDTDITYTLRVVSGTGAGTIRTNLSVVSGNNNTLDLSSPNELSEALDITSRYTLNASTVDEFGKLSGIFNIPSDDNLKFKTGERLFTITDANDYLDGDAQMRATAQYVASGQLNTVQEVRVPETPDTTTPAVVNPAPTQPPPPIIICVNMRRRWRRRRRRDPVAQTFFVPEPASADQDYGIFVSSVDLYFKSKPLEVAGDLMLPVSAKIVSVVNGYPTQDVLATATVYPQDVVVTDGVSSVPSVDDPATRTKFTFDNPVYLFPSTEYAIVVFSESPEYEVWISELGESIIGTDRRVSEQPYAGSFFRSQNASTWTPFQNQDLMFVINNAVFSNGGQVSFKIKPPATDVYLDELLLHATDISFPATNVAYGFKGTKYSTGALESGFTALTPNEYLEFGSDLENSSVLNDRRRVILAGNSSSLQLQVSMVSGSNTVSPLFNSERLALIGVQNIINDGGILADNIMVDEGGGQHFDAANITVELSGGYQTENGTPAELYVDASDLDGTGNITSLSILTPGSGYLEMPTVIIKDSSPTVTANATAIINGEDSSFGGNALARYVTRKITLADGFDAGDLRVFLRAIRPQGTDLAVYYKVLSSSDPDYFYNKKWKRMEQVQNLYSIGQKDYVELQYRPNLISGRLSYVEDGVEYPLGGSFKYFAVKVVMFAKDTTVVPYIKSFRAIASPEG